MDKADLFGEAINTFIRVQTAKRLAALGGTMPQVQAPTRRALNTDQWAAVELPSIMRFATSQLVCHPHGELHTVDTSHVILRAVAGSTCCRAVPVHGACAQVMRLYHAPSS